MLNSSPVYGGSAAVLPPSGSQQCMWTGGYSQGTTSITLSSCGGAPTVGQLIVLDQANDATDTGGIFLCDSFTQANTPAQSCSVEDGAETNADGRTISNTTYSQKQVTKIDGVTSLGGGSYTITLDTGVYFNNIRSGQSPGAWWIGIVQNEGLENLTIDGTAITGTNDGNLQMWACYQCWVKNVVSLNAARNHFEVFLSYQDTIRDSYLFGNQSHSTVSYAVEYELSSAVLTENNIMQQTTNPIISGNCSGCVIDYNFSVGNLYTAGSGQFMQPASPSHNAGNDMNLWEGNVMVGFNADDTWGSSNVNTYFRNALAGWQSGKTATTNSIIVRANTRADNIVGNILGQSGYHTTYQSYATSTTGGVNGGGTADLSIYSLGWNGNGGNGACTTPPLCDASVFTSLMRWGNYDTVNATTRWNSTEAAPGAITYTNANFTSSYFNTLAQTLPASLYYASAPSWWPSSKNWPPIGPDISSGNVGTCSGTYSGAQGTSSSQCTGGALSTAWASHVTSIPAQDCYLTTMGGPPDGSGSALAFDANSCYGGSSTSLTITSPTSGQLIQTVGMTILSATVTSPSVRSRLVWYMENIRLGTTFGTNAQLATIPANAACLASWDGPWTMQCNLAAFGDGPHAIYAKLFAENVDASTGSPEASASTTYTERVSGASTQSIASMPTSGASSPMEVQTFTNGTLGSSENSGVYVDGQILSQGCGANNTTTWTSGYQVPTFFTTCFPNGTHWLTATYNMSVALPNSTILSQVVTFSGSTVSASTSHYVTNGQPVAFSTTGTIPTTLIAGNEYVNTSGSGNPSYSISGSTMTILLPSSPSTTIVANTTQVRIWNTKVNNYIGQACDGYYTVSTVTSQTNFGITVPASCPSSISTASKGFDVIVNPFCGSYAGSNTLQFQVTACPSGSPITPSGGSGTLSVNVRPISPEWGYTDLIESGVQFFVQGQYTFSNGAVPMEMEPTIAEYHNTQGNSDTLTLNIKNTDLSLTASSCTASGVTCTAADIGPVTGAFSWNNSTQTMTYNSTGSWTNPSGYPTAWETLTISKTGVEQGAVVYFQNHGSANVVPHFSHSGKILTTFTNGSSFFPLEVEGGPSPQFPAVWAGSHLQQSYFNSAYLGISANDNISNLAATSCSYSNQYGLAESWAAQWGQNLSLDTVYLFVGDYSSFRASVFWGIMSNLGYNRQACVQTLVSHLITAGVYWRLRIDDEWSDQMGKYLNSNVPISASGLFTQAAVSGSGSSQQIVFSVQDTNLNSGTGGVGAWSQSAGTGTVLQITGATHFPNQIYLPSTTNATTITAPCIGCTNGTYTSTTDSGAAMVINPFTGQGFQNVSAWPNNAHADSVTWSGGTINLTSIVCSGSTCTVNFSGAHGLTCTSPDNIVRIWSSSSGLNIVSAISSCATNSFVVTYPGGTGGTAPSPMTYTSATDPSLYITLDDTVNAAFQSFWQTVVGGVSNSPAYCFSMLGSLFGTSNAAGTQSYQFPTYATQPCSIGYIPQLDYKNIYGFDTSASGWGTYGNLESVITMRPWMAQPTSFYFAGSGAGYQPFLPGMTFNPATDHPGQLNNRPEGPVQQYANMLISGAKAMTLYSFYNTLVSSVEPGGGICSPSGCGLVANTNIGANYGIGPYVQPQQWNALTLLNSSVTQNQSLLLQPACDHQYFGPFFGVLGVGCFTGSDGTIQIVDCQSESPYGSFPINTQASAGGSVWLEFIDGWTRSLTLVAGNPSTITQEWCPAPGMWLIKALPSGSTLIDTMNFNPTLPSGATVAYVHVGYSPYDLYDTPGTLCTSRCSVPIQHNNSPAYYYVTYSSSTAPILSYNPQPIQVPSQGLP